MLLTLRQKLRASYRLLGVIGWILVGVICTLLFIKVDQHHPYTRRQQQIIRWWMRGLLQVTGVSLAHNAPSSAPIWVANHVSWCDIIALMAIQPSRFLAKSEVARWTVIGWLAQRAGTVFIDRGAHQAQAVTEQLSHLLRLGDRVVFFPEGTSQGDEPRRFHARLFALPIAEQATVTPVSLTYQDKTGLLRADLSYTGTQSFVENLWHLLQQDGICLHVSFMPDIASAGLSRKDLAEACHTAVVTGWKQTQL